MKKPKAQMTDQKRRILEDLHISAMNLERDTINVSERITKRKLQVDQALQQLNALEITKEEFHTILCEFPPSIAEDSGQPEWTTGEIDRIWDFITGKKKFIPYNRNTLEKIDGNIKNLQKICHDIAKETGHWDTERNNGEIIALMHSELSEALEGLRHNDWKNVAEEMADVTIRVFDFCEGRGINLEKAILDKIKKNRKRPYRHGKQF